VNHWTYPAYQFADINAVKPIAELWDDKSGVRLAIVARSNNWPDTSYVVCTPSDYIELINLIEVQGSFLEAQAVAIAISKLT
jgi:hypothetical protein